MHDSEELQGVWNVLVRALGRAKQGQETYGVGTWQHKDMGKEMVEELLDFIVYAAFQVMKVEEVCRASQHSGRQEGSGRTDEDTTGVLEE